MPARFLNRNDEPPRLDGGAEPAYRKDEPFHVLRESRSLIALEILPAFVRLMPKADPVVRARAAWEQANALLAVRAEEREKHINKLKEEGNFEPREEMPPRRRSV